MAFALTAQPRTVTRSQNKQLRDKKIIPAVLYGTGVENTNVQVSAKEFEKVYEQAGENQVVELTIEGSKPHDVIIREVQINPVKRDIVHADFQSIDVNKPIEVELPIHFTGVAPAVKVSGGSLVKKTDYVNIRCKPKDFIPFIEVSVDNLETLEDSITIADLDLPKNIEVLDNPQDMIATVVPPRVEAEPEPAEAEEGEEAAEGEKPAEGEEAKEKAEGEEKAEEEKKE